MKNKPNLEKITKEGFSYLQRYYFDQSLEVYVNDNIRIIYDPKDDIIVMRTNYDEDKN